MTQKLQELENNLNHWANTIESHNLKNAQKVVQKIINVARQNETSLLISFDYNLSSIPEDIWNLTQLQVLELDRNKLTSIPPQIGQLTQLKELSLNDNQLTSIPPQIGQLTQLKELYLNDNQLTSIPPEIGQLTQLTFLNLSNNLLASLPPEIGQLTQLTMLFLQENQLTNIPPEIGQLTQLDWLNLSFNKLTNIPPEIGQLTQLRTLTLGRNKLTSIPKEIGQLTQLDWLILSENILTSLPKQIGQLTQLIRLDFSGNNIYFLPENFPNRFIINGFATNISTILDLAKHQVLRDLNNTDKTKAFIAYAQEEMAEQLPAGDKWAINNTCFINQLIGYKDIWDNSELLEAQKALCRQYWGLVEIKPFVEQLQILDSFDEQQEQPYLIFVKKQTDGIQTDGISISRECYEKNVLLLPSTNNSTSIGSWISGLVIHESSKTLLVQNFDNDLKAFPLLYQAYQKEKLKGYYVSRKNFINILNLPDNLPNNSDPKIIQPTRANFINAFNSRFESGSIDDYDENLMKALYPLMGLNGTKDYSYQEAIITDKHYRDILQVFGILPSSITKNQSYLLYGLATLMIKYSSKRIFGSEYNSPFALRVYAWALLNKAVSIYNEPLLNPNIIKKILDYQNRLLGIGRAGLATCTDILCDNMTVDLKRDANLIYQILIPEAWQD